MKNILKKAKKMFKKKKVRKALIISSTVLAIFLVAILSYFFINNANQAKEAKKLESIKTYNRSFEDAYQKITSHQYDFGQTFNIGATCTINQESQAELTIFDTSLKPVKDISSTVTLFDSCLRNKMGGTFNGENSDIDSFVAKIEGLQNDKQKSLAQQIVQKSRDFVSTKQKYNGDFSTYYDKEITAADMIQSYLLGSTSINQRNQAVDDMNATFSTMGTENRQSMALEDNIYAERQDLFTQLKSILPR